MQRISRRGSVSEGLLLGALVVAWGTGWAQSNPIPLINQPLVPDAVAPGSVAFTLTVNGTGFTAGAVVKWNGSPLPTTFVKESQLTASVSASQVVSEKTASITVTNPPPGGGTSNSVYFTVTLPTPSVLFTTSYSPASESPAQIVGADFNGDGKGDVAVAATDGGRPYDNGTVDVYLGNGNGTFQNRQEYPVEQVYLLATADVNQDGYPDLIAANGSIVQILLGTGTGTFTYGNSYSITDGTLGICVGDFDGNGTLDLAISTSGPNVVILLGNGDGTFQTGATVPLTAEGEYLVTGDFNGDGHLDLAVTLVDDSDIDVLLGQGNGTFGTPATYPVGGTYPFGIVAGDLNQDGILDLAVGNNPNEVVTVFIGNGEGTFQNGTTYVAGAGGAFLNLGDFNGDNIPDLAVAGSVALFEDGISIMLGNGNGTFQQYAFTEFASALYGMTTVDLTGNGRLDFALTDGLDQVVWSALQGPFVGLSPGSLSFGNQYVETSSSPQVVTLTNTGTASLLISSIAIGGTNSGDFSQTNTCGSSVNPGANCAITVVFTPTATGSRAANVTITDNAPESPQTVSLSGTGTSAQVSFSPALVTYSTQLVGTVSPPQNVTLTNAGTGTLLIASRTVTGDFNEVDTCGGSVAAGANCTVTIRYKPLTKGAMSGSVAFTDNAPASPQSLPLSGTGTVVNLSTMNLDFGIVRVGQRSAPAVVTLTNEASNALEISNIAISGGDASDFQESNTCSRGLGARRSCEITITFAPKSTGSLNATLGIVDNGGGSPQEVILSGTGIQ